MFLLRIGLRIVCYLAAKLGKTHKYTRMKNDNIKGLFRTTLPVSFQFHHVQLEGGHGATFLENLQTAMNALG